MRQQGQRMEQEQQQYSHPLDTTHGLSAAAETAHGSVVVGVAPLGMMVKPGSVYHVRVPVTPLNAEVDSEPLRRIANSSNLLGTIYALGGLALLIMAAVLNISLPFNVLAGFVVGSGVAALLHGLIICGAPGTISSLLLGAISLGFGCALVLGHYEWASLVLIVSLWLCTKGLALGLHGINSAVLTTWWAAAGSGLVSLALGAWVLLKGVDSTVMVLSIVVGADLLASALGVFLLGCMAHAGAHLAQGRETSHPDMTSPLYNPLEST